MDDREHVGLAQDQVRLVVERDFGAAVLPVEHLVADLHVHRDALVLLESARSDRDDLALLRLFLGGVGDVQAAAHLLRVLQSLDDNTVSQRCDLHGRGALGSHGSPASSRMGQWHLYYGIGRLLALHSTEC
jgi:hypothetical protein